MGIAVELIPLSLDEAEAVAAAGRFETLAGRCCAGVGDEVLPLFIVPIVLQRRRDGESWFWAAPRLIVDPARRRVVGSITFKHAPVGGAVEIGYGVADADKGKGFATGAVAQMAALALSRPEVTAVVAETATDNLASQRVLEKNGFGPTGSRVDAEDGPLTLWRLEAAAGSEEQQPRISRIPRK